jgi:hypothetical protein
LKVRSKGRLRSARWRTAISIAFIFRDDASAPKEERCRRPGRKGITRGQVIPPAIAGILIEIAWWWRKEEPAGPLSRARFASAVSPTVKRRSTSPVRKVALDGAPADGGPERVYLLIGVRTSP